MAPPAQAGPVHTRHRFQDRRMSPSSPQSQVSLHQESIPPASAHSLRRSNGSPTPLGRSRSLQGSPGHFTYSHADSGLSHVDQAQSSEALLIDPILPGSSTSSVNPADLMDHFASPFAIPTDPPRIARQDISPHHPTSDPSFDAFMAFHPTPISPRHSLDPASAAFPHGQGAATDWSGMMQDAAFHRHRRTPSEASDLSSSVAPSPYLANTDGFDPMDAQPSPLLRSQPDPSYHDGLGIEHFTISDHVHRQPLTDLPSPHISPLLSPHGDLDLGRRGDFVLMTTETGLDRFDPGLQTVSYGPVRSERVPGLHLNDGASEMGLPTPMAPPEINIEFAAPSRQQQQHLEPPRSLDDSNALSPPERGKIKITTK